MKQIKTEDQQTVQPITIEFTGAEAVALTDFLGKFTLKKIQDLMMNGLIKDTSPEKIDRVTDDLFETLIDHIRA